MSKASENTQFFKHSKKIIQSLRIGELISLFLLLGCVISQTSAAKTSDSVATEVQEAYLGLQDLSMKFRQKTYVEILEKDVFKSGEIKLKKGGKFLVLYEGPEGRHYYSSGKKLWIYRLGDSQVQTASINDQGIPPEALSFLGGLGDLKREFAVKEVDPQKWESFKREKGSLDWLELIPQKNNSQIAWMVMGFNPQTHIAEEIYLFTDSENLTHYVFSEMKMNQSLQDSLFEFNQKGVKEVKFKTK